MKDYRAVLIALLLGIAGFSGYKHFFILKEKQALVSHLEQINAQLTDLTEEKQALDRQLEKEKQIQEALSQENTVIKNDLQQNKDKLNKLYADFQVAQNVIEDLNAQISVTKAETVALREQIEGMKVEVSAAVQGKEQLEARLGSIEELKKAIRELRKKTHTVSQDVKKNNETERILLGNLGYIVKGGTLTYQPKVKIEVQPLPGEN